MKRILGLAPNVFFLGLVSLLNDFSSEMIYAVMPAFLTVVLGAPPVFVGFMEGLADAMASFLKIFAGWFSDRIGKRKIIAISGYSLSVATRLFLALVANFWQVFVLRVIDRVGKGFRDSPRDALIAESVERKELGKSFGYHRAMDSIGAVLGPLAGIVLLATFLDDNYRSLFLVGFVAGLLAVATFVFVKDTPQKIIRTDKANIKDIFSLGQFSGAFKKYILAIFIFGLGVMPTSLMTLKSQGTDFGNLGIPALYLLSSISFILFAIPLGRLSDKIGEKKVLIFGFVIAIVSYIILAIFNSIFSLVAGFIIFGLYLAMTDGISRALASKLVRSDQLATGQGFLNAAIGISSLLAGVIGGGIWTIFNSTAAFVYGLVLMIIGLAVFIYLNGSEKELELIE
ncbi:MAG: MFS transporter [bacterium]|nr:MFS transporter [bacterium]